MATKETSKFLSGACENPALACAPLCALRSEAAAFLAEARIVEGRQARTAEHELSAAEVKKLFVGRLRVLRSLSSQAIQGAPSYLMQGDIGAGSRGGLDQICAWIGALEILMDVGWYGVCDVSGSVIHSRETLLKINEPSILTVSYFLIEKIRGLVSVLREWKNKVLFANVTEENANDLASLVDIAVKRARSAIDMAEIMTDLSDNGLLLYMPNRVFVVMNAIVCDVLGCDRALAVISAPDWAAERSNAIYAVETARSACMSIDAMLNHEAVVSGKTNLAKHLVWFSENLNKSIGGLIEYCDAAQSIAHLENMHPDPYPWPLDDGSGVSLVS